MRSDDEIGVLAAGDGHGDRRRQAARGAPAIDDLADGADVDAVVLEHLDEGFFELGGAGCIEQLEQARRRAADVFTALRDDAKERLAAARGTSEPVEAAVLAGTAFLFDQTVEVLVLLDLLA